MIDRIRSTRFMRFAACHQSQLFLVAVALFAFSLAACSLPQWIATAQSILPIAAEMAAGIIALIGAFAGGPDAGAIATLNTVMTAVGKALTDIQAMVEEYNSTPSTTLLGSIQAAIKAVTDQISQLLTDTGITNTALQAKVVDILQLLMNEVTAWASLVPIINAAAGSKFELIVPLDAKGFKQAYNAILATPTGVAEVDEALAKVKRL